MADIKFSAQSVQNNRRNNEDGYAIIRVDTNFGGPAKWTYAFVIDGIGGARYDIKSRKKIVAYEVTDSVFYGPNTIGGEYATKIILDTIRDYFENVQQLWKDTNTYFIKDANYGYPTLTDTVKGYNPDILSTDTAKSRFLDMIDVEEAEIFQSYSQPLGILYEVLKTSHIRLKDLNERNASRIGATIAGLVIAEIGDRVKLSTLNAGDSRIYLYTNNLYTNNNLRQVSVDHKYDEAVTQAIGLRDIELEAILNSEEIQSGRILLATDGLYAPLDNRAISMLMADQQSTKETLDELVYEAGEFDKSDNATGIIISINEEDKHPQVEQQPDTIINLSNQPIGIQRYSKINSVNYEGRKHGRILSWIAVGGIIGVSGIFGLYNLRESLTHPHISPPSHIVTTHDAINYIGFNEYLNDGYRVIGNHIPTRGNVTKIRKLPNEDYQIVRKDDSEITISGKFYYEIEPNKSSPPNNKDFWSDTRSGTVTLKR